MTMTFVNAPDPTPLRVIETCSFCGADRPQGEPHHCPASTAFYQGMRAAWEQRRDQERADAERETARLLHNSMVGSSLRAGQVAYARLCEASAKERANAEREHQICTMCRKRIVPKGHPDAGQPDVVERSHGMAHRCEKPLDPATEILVRQANTFAAMPAELAELRRKIAEMEAQGSSGSS